MKPRHEANRTRREPETDDVSSQQMPPSIDSTNRFFPPVAKDSIMTEIPIFIGLGKPGNLIGRRSVVITVVIEFCDSGGN